MTDEEKRKANIKNGQMVCEEAHKAIKELQAASEKAGEPAEVIMFATHGGLAETAVMCNAKGGTILDAVLHLYDALPVKAKALAAIKVVEGFRDQIGAGSEDVHIDKSKLH